MLPAFYPPGIFFSFFFFLVVVVVVQMTKHEREKERDPSQPGCIIGLYVHGSSECERQRKPVHLFLDGLMRSFSKRALDWRAAEHLLMGAINAEVVLDERHKWEKHLAG